MKIKTWYIESLVVFCILFISTYFLTENRLQDWLSALAVQITFHYVSVANRLEEAQEVKIQGINFVECKKWLTRYLVSKELLWICVFLISNLYPPLIGTILFLIYPFWRKIWRKYHLK